MLNYITLTICCRLIKFAWFRLFYKFWLLFLIYDIYGGQLEYFILKAVKAAC